MVDSEGRERSDLRGGRWLQASDLREGHLGSQCKNVTGSSARVDRSAHV